MLNGAYDKDVRDLKVTIIDDNKNTLEILKVIFLELKVKKIYCFSSANEAFEHVKASETDIIILDWFMEPVSGRKFLMRLRHHSMSVVALTPVIVVTLTPSEAIIKEILMTGADEILAKPISPLQMLKRLKAVASCNIPYREQEGFFVPGTYAQYRTFAKNNKEDALSLKGDDSLYI